MTKLKHLSYFKARLSKVSPAVGVDGLSGGRKFLAQLFLNVVLLVQLGCGDGGNIVAPIETPDYSASALANTPATLAAVAAASPMKTCPHDKYFIAMDNASWQVMSSYDFTVLDTLEIRENCTFRSYNCGTLGYIVSGGENFNVGIVNIMMLGHLFPKAGCYALGEQVCSYGRDGDLGLRFRCQLLTPQTIPWKP